MRLDNKIMHGIVWTSLSTFGSQGLRLLFKLILAKLLLPEHYGIIGMATVFISFVEVISELGLNSALIQKKKDSISAVYFDTAFWANLFISTVGYLVIVIGIAPFAAWFYGEQILTQLIPVLAISVIINAFYVIPKVILSRKMDFKPQAFIEIAAAASSGVVAVILAYLGYGVWALAFNGILISLVSSLLYFFKVRWIPHFHFDAEAFRDMFGFGSKVLIEQVFSFLTLNIDYILIGKLIGGTALGAYTLAFMLTSTFMKQIVKILNKVLYPAYAAMQDDVKRIGHYYLKLAKINNLIMAPIMLLFFVGAEAIILQGFGSEWRAAIFPLKILALAVIISSIGGSSAIVMRSMGRPDLSMKLNVLCTTFSTVPFIIVGATLYGINGAALGILLDRIVRFVAYQYQIKRLISVTVLDLVKQVSGTLCMCVLMGLIIYGLDRYFHTSHVEEIVMATGVIVFTYSLYLYLFERKIVNKVLEITKIGEKMLLPLFNAVW